ncbi:ChpI protein [Leptospira congkakensis]|uniref:ChpI protein n=1 Tax=Leptospira congkakensis TaxID=2484932 RepID=A0A4Z1AJG0_9LEPT|nr:ChpI protein [Leptospira congkakensis]TGL85595.1 ChpI protein [Leptospira congkakensis]TGL92354.1 ChpI protein [Leptospira congkakensis]TGM00100.1 ChpI protein [Leptospira congkakensis]
MKTAISIPDDLFVSAENTAKKLGIPRSQLFAIALEEFIENHSKEKITKRLNEVYTKSSHTTDNLISDISVSTLRSSLKDDTW